MRKVAIVVASMFGSSTVVLADRQHNRLLVAIYGNYRVMAVTCMVTVIEMSRTTRPYDERRWTP